MRGAHTSTNEEDMTHSVTRISSSMYLTIHITMHINKIFLSTKLLLVHHAPSLASFPVSHVSLGTGLLAPSCVSVKTVSQVPCGQKGTQN